MEVVAFVSQDRKLLVIRIEGRLTFRRGFVEALYIINSLREWNRGMLRRPCPKIR